MEEKTHQEIIEVGAGGKARVDNYLSNYFSDISRSRLQRAIKDGQLLLNGQTCQPSDKVSEGDTLTMSEGWLSEERQDLVHLKPAPLPLDILFEDEDVVVLNKPSDLVVHPGAGTSATTLVEGLLHHCLSSSGKPAGATFSAKGVNETDVRPGVVHRLDKDTTGVMVWCKNLAAQGHVAQQFAEKSNIRQYLALLNGVPKDDVVVVESYLGRDPFHRLRFKSISVADYQDLPPHKRAAWRHAKTEFRVVHRYQIGQSGLTLVKAKLYTGRTHQIRVHAKSLGCPVAGDSLYGRNIPYSFEFLGKIPRQMLHAALLGFTHPSSGRKLAFEADLPADFRAVLDEIHLRLVLG